MTKYYSDDEVEHESVETHNENKSNKKDIDCIDINILLDKLDSIVSTYENEESRLSCIGLGDYLFSSRYKCSYKYNKTIYDLSTDLYKAIQSDIKLLSDEDAAMFENISVNLIYSRIMKCIGFRHLRF